MEKKQRSTKIKITKRALFQRINRKLKPQGEKLYTPRTEAAQEQLGAYCVVATGEVVQPKRTVTPGAVRVHVDLEKLGRELGVIEPWEELES